MKRIAYCSPVNPLQSGISDYSEEILPFLGQYAEVVLFVPRGVVPANATLRRHIEVQMLDQLIQMQRTKPFDALLYHLGNSPVHAEIYEAAQQLPGVVVLHDWVLHHFKLWYAASRKGDVGLYLHEMEQRYGVRGAAVGARMASGRLLDAAFEMPLVHDVVEKAVGVIGHSSWVVDRVRRLRPAMPAQAVPMGVPLPPLIPMESARRELGLPSGPIWASFGHINPYKRMESALRAFRRFRAQEPEARYVLVGSVSPSYDLHALIHRLDLQDVVMVTGYTSPEDFARYVAAADLCLNLRYPTAGETSASLLRLLGAGRPTLVSAVDALDELPEGVCAKVDLGASEQDQILAYARTLRRLPALARQLGLNARRYVAENHSLEGAARAYMDFLARLHGWETPTPQRPVLWQSPLGNEPGGHEVRSAHASPLLNATKCSAMQPVAKGPLQAPALLGDLLQELGSAMAELGVPPDDQVLLPEVAGTIADLFASPEAGEGPRSK